MAKFSMVKFRTFVAAVFALVLIVGLISFVLYEMNIPVPILYLIPELFGFEWE